MHIKTLGVAAAILPRHDMRGAQQGRIKDIGSVGGSDDEAVGLVVLNHLQEAIQHTPNLAHIVSRTTLRTDGIKFIKEEDAGRGSGGGPIGSSPSRNTVL